jgi:hypothetical protein
MASLYNTHRSMVLHRLGTMDPIMLGTRWKRMVSMVSFTMGKDSYTNIHTIVFHIVYKHPKVFHIVYNTGHTMTIMIDRVTYDVKT